MNLNEKIREKLEEIDPIVFYGQAEKLDETVLWNYIVFFREKRSNSENRTSHAITFHVAVVRENEIPEGLEETVIEKIMEIPGVRLGSECSYAYTIKPGTGAAVEVLDIPFSKTMKGR